MTSSLLIFLLLLQCLAISPDKENTRGIYFIQEISVSKIPGPLVRNCAEPTYLIVLVLQPVIPILQRKWAFQRQTIVFQNEKIIPF